MKPVAALSHLNKISTGEALRYSAKSWYPRIPMPKEIKCQRPYDEEADGDVLVQIGRPKIKDPPRFAVMLLNDDYTTMEFVIEVLRRYFRKTDEEAVRIMLQVHQQGKGLAGIYHFEIAETKIMQVHEYARSHGFPLSCTLEQVD